MDTIFINGDKFEWPRDDPLSHEKVCELAGEPDCASVTYNVKKGGDLSRHGMTHVGKSIAVEDGMVISCIVTGNA